MDQFMIGMQHNDEYKKTVQSCLINEQEHLLLQREHPAGVQIDSQLFT